MGKCIERDGVAMSDHRDRRLLLRNHAKAIFDSGIKAVAPGAAIRRCLKFERGCLVAGGQRLDLNSFKNVYIIGFGKAAASMTLALEDMLGQRISGGSITVKYGHEERMRHVDIVSAGHPVPDANGQAGAAKILDIAMQADENDLIICLISGGGSALLPLPVSPLTLSDKQKTIRTLLSCGATIHEINTIRKHTSRIKGGWLARYAYPARMITLILSDVVGDDLSVIASGPTVPDESTFGMCRDIIETYNIAADIPKPVLEHLKNGIASGSEKETPKAGDPVFERNLNVLIGTNMDAIMAAKMAADRLGYHSLILSSMIEGETRDVAGVHAAIAAQILKTGHPVQPPACLLSGGETTVTLKGDGKGGRNQEFALALAMGIDRKHTIVGLSAGTDGNDGETDAAGAITDCCTVSRAERCGMDTGRFLANNDSHSFFKAIDDLLITGPTNTNVMDLRILLIE